MNINLLDLNFLRELKLYVIIREDLKKETADKKNNDLTEKIKDLEKQIVTVLQEQEK